MPRRDRRHTGRRRRWLVFALVVVVIGAVVGVGQWRYDALREAGRRLGILAPVKSGPAAVAPPPGLELPAQPVARPVASPLGAGDPSAAKVAAALAPYAGAKALGSDIRVLVMSASGAVLFHRGSGPITPASTTKLLTSTAALDTVGPMTRFATTTRLVPDSHRIVLVGGGDPYLASTAAAAKGIGPARATLSELAAQTAKSLRAHGLRRVRLGYDDSLFSGPAVDPQWPASYLSEDVVPPISALWVDEAKTEDGYDSTPALGAATVFAKLLAARGITVVGIPGRTVAPTDGTALGVVHSAPLGQIVQRLIAVSDNNAAEVVARHVGIAVEGHGSFAAATRSIRTVLRRLGVDTTGLRMYDGSGLSRKDRIDPRTLLGALRVDGSADHPQLRDVITGLPIAGFDGSLAHRYDDAPRGGLGRVRAKTGTLTGVSGLVGTAVDLDGDQLYFAAMADKIAPEDTLDAREALDRITAALGACHCRADAASSRTAGTSP